MSAIASAKADKFLLVLDALGKDMAKEAGRAKGNGLEQTLWLVADKPATQMAGKLRKNIDAAFKNNDRLKTNTALQMPALECCYRGEAANLFAYGGDRVQGNLN